MEKDLARDKPQTLRKLPDSKGELGKLSLSHWISEKVRREPGPEAKNTKESSFSKINFELSKDNEIGDLDQSGKSPAAKGDRRSQSSATSIGKFIKSTRSKIIGKDGDRLRVLESLKKQKQFEKKKVNLIEINNILERPDRNRKKTVTKAQHSEDHFKE